METITETMYRTKGEIAGFVAALREETDLTQEEVAEALGMSQSAVSRVESGTRGLALEELLAYANYFGKNPDEILRKDVEGLALMRGENIDSEAARDAVALFREVIRDYFGAEALVR